VALPDLGDLSILVKEEGYKGEFFEPECSASLALALENILKYDSYRIHLGMTNYKAACSLPMSDITQMYVDYFRAIQFSKSTGTELNLKAKMIEEIV